MTASQVKLVERSLERLSEAGILPTDVMRVMASRAHRKAVYALAQSQWRRANQFIQLRCLMDEMVYTTKREVGPDF